MTDTPLILVIRPYDLFSAMLSQNGHEVRNLELIRTQPVGDAWDDLRAIDRLEDYDGLFITSPAAAEVLVSRRAQPAAAYGGVIYVLGQRAEAVLEGAGLTVVSRASANNAAEFIAGFDESEFSGKRFLFLRGDHSLRVIPELLSSAAQVDEAIVYRTIEVRPEDGVLEDLGAALKDGRVAWICFFSPSGVANFRKLVASELTNNLAAAAIGNTTAQAAADAGLDVRYVATKASAADFAAGFLEHLKTSG